MDLCCQPLPSNSKFTVWELKNHHKIKPSLYGTLLQNCLEEKSFHGGLQLHGAILKRGLCSDRFLQSSLLSLYLRCNHIELARRIFDESDIKDNLICWNSMISKYSNVGLTEKAMLMFLELQRFGLKPDQYTLSSAISNAERKGDIFMGMQIHCIATKLGQTSEEFVGTSLLQFYAACGCIDDSFRAFQEISGLANSAAWNSMIARFAEWGFSVEAIKLYIEMQKNGVEVTAQTFSSLLKSVYLAEQVHAQIIVRDLCSNLILETALMDLYIDFGELQKARTVFTSMSERNAMTWNSIIKGYSQSGSSGEALNLFLDMLKEGFLPDDYTFPSILNGVAEEKYSRELHTFIIKLGLDTHPFVASALITMYSKSLSFKDSKSVFKSITSSARKDTVVWSSMMSASLRNGATNEAIQLFFDMLNLDLKPSNSIFSTLFSACGTLPSLAMGRQVHAYLLKLINESPDVAVQNSLVTMYSNCGCIDESRKIFDSIENPDIISLNSIILALAQHGCANEASVLFNKFEKPDEITVLNLLLAFNHAGLVDKALELFNSMEKIYGIRPTYEHHACLIDTLARAGEIQEAVRCISRMQYERDEFSEPSLLRNLLGACCKHRNLETGKQIGELLLEIEPDEATNFVLLANVYARSGKLLEADRIRHMMAQRGIHRDVLGVSWIEIQGSNYVFGVEDRSNPFVDEIYAKLYDLISEIKSLGYVPDTNYVLREVENQVIEDSLYHHSEKLAFAFGVLRTSGEYKLRIMKNIRICGDCHSAFKYFSVVTGREIVLRDNCRFHHFINGACSCGDYW